MPPVDGLDDERWKVSRHSGTILVPYRDSVSRGVYPDVWCESDG
jgi:hypothetical protein